MQRKWKKNVEKLLDTSPRFRDLVNRNRRDLSTSAGLYTILHVTSSRVIKIVVDAFKNEVFHEEWNKQNKEKRKVRIF